MRINGVEQQLCNNVYKEYGALISFIQTVASRNAFINLVTQTILRIQFSMICEQTTNHHALENHFDIEDIVENFLTRAITCIKTIATFTFDFIHMYFQTRGFYYPS